MKLALEAQVVQLIAELEDAREQINLMQASEFSERQTVSEVNQHSGIDEEESKQTVVSIPLDENEEPTFEEKGL